MVAGIHYQQVWWPSDAPGWQALLTCSTWVGLRGGCAGVQQSQGQSNYRVLLCPEGKPTISFSPPFWFFFFLLPKCALTVALSLTRASIQLCSCLLRTHPVLLPRAAGAQQTPRGPSPAPSLSLPSPCCAHTPCLLRASPLGAFGLGGRGNNSLRSWENGGEKVDETQLQHFCHPG